LLWIHKFYNPAISKKEGIMKKIFLLSGILLAISVLSADTHIPAGDVNGTWTSANSPYIIDGEINIQVGDELTIEPGIEVIFSGHYKFNIYGRLLAQGTESDSIYFTAQDTTAGWHGLRFSDTETNGQDSSKVVYCKLEYGKAIGSNPDNCGGAIHCSYSSDILIENCLITKNSAELFGGGININNSSPVLTGVTISRNSSGIDGGGINCYSSNPVLTNVIICKNTATFWGGAIMCHDSDPVLFNSTISGNTAENGGSFFCYLSALTIMNCILWNNIPEEIFLYSGSVAATYSDIQGGWIGTGNIDADPLFADTGNNDYNLTWANYPIDDGTKSPCIDSGDPAPGYNDPDGTRNDMGALYFHQSVTLGAPQNVIISVSSDSVDISWDSVENATSYKIYSSNDPYVAFENWTFQDEIAETSWSEAITEEKEFYHVTAVN